MSGNANEQGIISISFLPTFGDSVDIGPKISELFQGSEKIRSSIAFWTLSHQNLITITNDKGMLQAIKTEDSFLCCDIQLPTNIDALASLKRAGVNVHLNFRRLVPALKNFTSSLGLLHTKMLLADKKDGTAEIWVGSHNWTQFALQGINTEISVILHVEKSSSIYNEAYQFLKHIRSFCDEFDLNMVDEYKKLQVKDSVADEPESVIIDLEGLSVDSLSNSSIWLFGTEDRDYKSLRNVGRPIKLILTDSLTQKKYLYNASIIQTGQMTAYNSLANGLQFTGQKRYAFSNYGLFPVLEPPGLIPIEVESDAKFFVAVQILDKLSEDFDIRSASENKINLWENATSDPILSLEKVRSCYKDASHRQKNDITPLIQVPYFKERASVRKTGKEEYLLQPIEIKRARREYQFVSKGVIRIR